MLLLLCDIYKGCDRVAMSKAHIEASSRYNQKNYRSFTVNAKISEYEKIEKYCNDNNISKNKLLLSAAAYVIDHNIKL